jgi:hypothetical protein
VLAGYQRTQLDSGLLSYSSLAAKYLDVTFNNY